MGAYLFKMEALEKYSLCIVCDSKYITYEKYLNDDKICPKCRKKDPVTMFDQTEDKKRIVNG